MRNLIVYLLLFGCSLSCSTGRCRQIVTPADKEASEAAAAANASGEKAVNSDLAKGATTESTKGPGKDTVRVYRADGSKQCGGGGVPADEMAKQLKKIKVLSSLSTNDGKMRIQMCGAPTGNINIFEIAKGDLKKAEKLGFKLVETP